MKNHLYCKILAIGIIVLFMGVGIHPAISVDIRQQIKVIERDESEDCNDCEKTESGICDSLWDIIDSIVSFQENLLIIEYKFSYNPILLKMLHIIEDMTHIYGIFVYNLGGHYNCSWYEPMALKFLL